MKRLSIIKIAAVFVTAIIFIAACTKETANVKLDPKLTTSQSVNVKWDSATVVGFIVSSGSGFTERGVCYDTVTGPTTASNKVVYTGQATTASFKVVLPGLARLTKYYAKAYAINASGTLYGEELTFSTTAALPTIADISASTLTLTHDSGITAKTTINITDDGGPDPTANITARGVVFALSAHPMLTDSLTKEGTGKGTFNSLALKLKGNKTYYLRAYATNSIGTMFSNEVSFTTPISFGMAKTNSASAITQTTMTLNGLVNYDGGGTISEKGFVYGLTSNPTTSDNKVVVTSSTDTITTDLTGLTKYTRYHVRAFVTNNVGTYYGADKLCTTLPDITKFWIVGDYNGWGNNDAANYIISTPTSGATAEGYVNLTTGSIKLVTDHSWDNAHTYGDDGSGGLTNTNGGANIPVATAGYYLIKASLSDNTYTLTLTNWGVIGDATPGGWGAQTDMPYNATTQTFNLGLHLLGTKAIKFRGTSDWGVNYGSTAADGSTLNDGGANITIAADGDYALTLDLSHPNAYTYSANTWGLIGDATPGGWGADTPMSWDAVNKVFTATLDLANDGSKAFKFRANGAWTVNLGGALDALTQDGANLTVATAGNYTVTLDPWSHVATATLNKKKK